MNLKTAIKAYLFFDGLYHLGQSQSSPTIGTAERGGLLLWGLAGVYAATKV